MTTITVYGPAMCCSTGICGNDVDQRLVDLAVGPDWLKAQGVSVRRYGLSCEPAEFVANDTIRQIMQASEGDDLPVFMVDGALKAQARYPSRPELALWTGIAALPPEINEQARESIPETTKALTCCGPATEKPAAATSCCGGAAKSAPAKEKGR